MSTPFDRVLCYDDGSTDNTVTCAHALGWEMITGNPNTGVAVSRNRLAAAAETEWMHFHDADDLISPNYLRLLAPWCDAAHDIVSCDADWIDETSRALIISWRYDPSVLSTSPFPHLLANPMGLNSSLIRRSTWTAIGGCDERLNMWEDADVHIRLARNGARFHHVPEVLTWSLRRGQSFSHDYRKSWNYRLAALEFYSADPSAASVAPVLAAEAEKAAAHLLNLGDEVAARRSLALCSRLGGDPPTTRNPFLRALKPIFPSYPLFRWQCRRRDNPSAIA